jgi:prophage tail gpP-like protein
VSAEIVTLAAGAGRWTAFESVSVRAALDEAARSFRVEAALELGGAGTAWAFKAGTKVTVAAGGDPLAVGYVDKYEPSLDAETCRVVISGRSLSQDMIDSSAVHATGRFKDKTLADVAKALDPAGLGIVTDESLATIPLVQVTPGETVFRVIERLARSQELTLTGEADGRTRVLNAGKGRKRHAGGLVQGRTILRGDAVHDWSRRHSKVHVRGQRAFGHGTDALEIEAIANDSAVDRKRPLVIVVEEDTDKDRAKKRAKGRRDRAAGRSLTASVTVQGFRDEGGTLWEPGRLVWVESDVLQVQQDMLIEAATFEQNASRGTTTRLELVDPRAYGGKKGRASKSGKAWDQDESDAVDGALDGSD